MYLLIISKVSDESDLAYALDLYDSIEEARVMRQNELKRGNVHIASAIEEVRNRHITKPVSYTHLTLPTKRIV